MIRPGDSIDTRAGRVALFVETQLRDEHPGSKIGAALIRVIHVIGSVTTFAS